MRCKPTVAFMTSADRNHGLQMLRVPFYLGGDHDWHVAFLAVAICFLASLSAMSLFHRACLAQGRAQSTWIIIAGVTIGCGVWATHFIAIFAYRPGIDITYDVGLTASSLIVAAAVTSAGLGGAAVGSAQSAAPLGGVVVGSGAACMHYFGMAALELPGHATWSPESVLLSITMATAFGAAALTVAARGDGVGGTLIAAMLLTLATVSPHVTAMEGVRIIPDPSLVISSCSIDQTWLAVGIAACAVAVLGASLVAAQVDRLFAARAAEAAARLHGLADATTEPIAIREDNIIIDVNSSLESLVGSE
jgi:NO-binding membrane sensor protein with MHYT domain